MTKGAQVVLKRALRLDPIERAELIEGLYESFDKDRDKRVDRRWAEEVESRIDAYDAGRVQADSAEAVFRRIAKR